MVTRTAPRSRPPRPGGAEKRKPGAPIGGLQEEAAAAPGRARPDVTALPKGVAEPPASGAFLRPSENGRFKENKLEIEYDNTAFESERLLPDYNVELEVCCTELLETFKNMEKIYLKMEKLCSTTKGICDLETYHHGDNRTPLFNTWPTPYFYDVSVKLLDMYLNEIKLKQTIVQEIAHTTDQDLLMVYLSSWLYQPYIENTSKVLLESMLLETGHRPV
uniref:Cyclin-dependent kinase 2-interacting protein isoform X1 n=1 Tax=Pogona vitticeps TaxID=103695 RepID=A0A6J0TP56_9SAUR